MTNTLIILIAGLFTGVLFGAVPILIAVRLRARGAKDAALASVSGDMRVLQQRCESAEAETVRLRADSAALQTRYDGASQKAAELEGRCTSHEKQIENIRNEQTARDRRIEELTATIKQNQGVISGLETRLDSERRQADDKLKMLNEARDQLKSEFQNLANSIFDEKTKKFSEQSKSNLDLVLDPLRSQLGDFRKRIDDVYASETKDRQALSEHIKILTALNQQVSQDADNLTRALKGENKTQGNWGEMILKRALELSGLKEGAEYESQASFVNDEGSRQQPDIIVHLPEKRDIIIDSKITLVAYERAFSAANDADRETALAEHLQAVRTHIDQLSAKNYQNVPGISAGDYVLMFMPVEAAFVAAIGRDPDLFEYAYRKRIIIVCPSTLLVTLRTIQNMWQSEYQKRNVQDIARHAGDLYDKFVLFSETLADVKKAIGTAADKCETAVNQLVSGRGNIVSRIEFIRKLGVKTKKSLPAAMIESADADLRLQDQESDGSNRDTAE